MIPYIPEKRIGKHGYVSDNLAASINNAITCANLSISHEECINRWNELDYCRNCIHFGHAYNYNLCADGSALKIALDGVEIVTYCGWCKHFVNSHQKEAKQYSKLKQFFLNKIGFKRDNVKE